jgi:hypothetical protein
MEGIMVALMLSPEQVEAAPPAVRRWLEQQRETEFPAEAGPGAGPDAGPAEFDPERVAACELRHDGLACRVFLEFGEEPVARLHPSPLYALDIADIARNTGIARGNQLLACLNLINSALQVVRGDPGATLFAFDRNGRCYIQEVTHRALHLLRRDLLAPRPVPAAQRHPVIPVTCEPPYRCAAEAETATPELARLI